MWNCFGFFYIFSKCRVFFFFLNYKTTSKSSKNILTFLHFFNFILAKILQKNFQNLGNILKVFQYFFGVDIRIYFEILSIFRYVFKNIQKIRKYSTFFQYFFKIFIVFIAKVLKKYLFQNSGKF